MSRSSARLLYWSPRVLSILFAAFVSLFALDVFNGNEENGFWQTVLAFLIHMVPAAIVVIALSIAWRWEWLGATVFAIVAAFYSWTVLPRHWDWALIMASPLLLIAALFLANWVERGKLRSAL